MAALMLNMLEKLDHKLHQKNSVTDVLEKIEKKTGVKRLHFTLGVGSLWALYMIFGRGAELICNAIGFMYPAYSSISALESARTDDDIRWLTYWVVFASLCTVEFFSDFILFYIPFYWLLKCVFLIWCFLPMENNGSQFVFHRIIRPAFLKNKKTIDETLNKVANTATGLAAATFEAAAKVSGGKSD